MYNPKVSIIIPVYNGSDYVAEAIESALSQTYENTEVIVVNDGSSDSDATEKEVMRFGDKIKYIKKENGGVSTALNTGIKSASGEWISWLSHDDLYTSDKIEEQIKDVNKLKKLGYNCNQILFYCSGGFINSNGQLINKKTKRYKNDLYEPHDALYEIFKGNIPGGCGFLLPKDLFSKVGYFDEKLRYMQDIFMWEKAFIAGYGFYVNNEVMSLTRIHPAQTSATGKKFGYKDREKVGRYLLEHLMNLNDGVLLLKQYLYSCLKSNNQVVANMIYKKIKHELSAGEIIKAKLLEKYGYVRPSLRAIYYKIRFNSKR